MKKELLMKFWQGIPKGMHERDEKYIGVVLRTDETEVGLCGPSDNRN
jgi:hypothetical protein